MNQRISAAEAGTEFPLSSIRSHPGPVPRAAEQADPALRCFRARIAPGSDARPYPSPELPSEEALQRAAQPGFARRRQPAGEVPIGGDDRASPHKPAVPERHVEAAT